MTSPFDALEVRCIECGCSDSRRCELHARCRTVNWLRFDPLDARGVCPECEPAVKRWDSGDRDFRLPVVALAWAAQKRHIAINGRVLCAAGFSGTIRSRGAGGYNSITVHGVPTTPKRYEDDKGTHYDGVIEAAPLAEQKGINTRSVCGKCQRRFTRWLAGNPATARSIDQPPAGSRVFFDDVMAGCPHLSIRAGGNWKFCDCRHPARPPIKPDVPACEASQCPRFHSLDPAGDAKHARPSGEIQGIVLDASSDDPQTLKHAST